MKNLFNKKLFAEALRQIRIPFALFTGIMLGFSIIMTISNLFNGSEEYKLYHNSVYIFTSDALLYLPIAFALVMPVFIFKLFKFLTKRNASDFYHAIPCKCTCIMFTYATAALTAAIGEISSAASKGVYHKNNAARKVSRLTKAVNQMA